MNTFNIGDKVWVETSEHSASRATINHINGNCYYVYFIDHSNRQHSGEGTMGVPILEHKIQPIDYIGWDK